jgi:1,4-alpha-glucan branching enzyme
MAMLETVKKMKESAVKPGTAGAAQEVQFTLFAPEAKKVCIAGTFNDWSTKSTPMKKSKDGTWKVQVKLSPGRHEYKYFVDGAWAQDIPCAESAPNPFGTSNCVIGVE